MVTGAARRQPGAVRRRADVVTVAGLAAAFVTSLLLVVVAVGVGLCSLWGERCTDAEEVTVVGLTIAAGVTFVSGPVVRAAFRRQLRWLLALPVEVALIALGAWLTLAF